MAFVPHSYTINGERNKFYLHEVILQESLREESIKTGTEADSHHGDIAKLLKDIITAKDNNKNNPQPPSLRSQIEAMSDAQLLGRVFSCVPLTL